LNRPANLPLIGEPSATGMAKGFYETGKSAATLPGDVYAGRVDPLSDEGIKRAADMAMMTQLPSAPTVARRAASPALGVKQIEEQATKSYEGVREAMSQYRRSKQVPVDGADVAVKAKTALEDRFTDISAPKTFGLVDRLEKANTPAELLDIRREL